MKIKPGVVMSGLHISMRPVLMVADSLWKEHGKELVVTSALEGTHSPGSMHYYGLALDFRSRYFDKATRDKVVLELKSRLLSISPMYRVIDEATHVHVDNQHALY